MSNARFPAALPPRRTLQPAPPSRFYWQLDTDAEKPQGTNHIHWGVTAFAEWAENGAMSDSVQVEVEAPDEPTAIARAMAIIQRPNYRVTWVRESCTQDLAKKE